MATEPGRRAGSAVGVQTSGGEGAPTESISFVYTKFDDEFRQQKDGGSFGTPTKMGWDVALNKGNVSADGAPGEAIDPFVAQAGPLEYYVRFDGVGNTSTGQWLRLDGFSMELENTATVGAGGGGIGAGKVKMGEVSLSLGTSSALLALSQGLLEGKTFKVVEVEAYAAGGGIEGGPGHLIDEFWFENVTLTGLERDADLMSEVTLQAGKFSHDHADLKADGSGLGPHTLVGWDFIANKAYTHAGAQADIDFF